MRFTGFADLIIDGADVLYPDTAAKELEYAVNELELKGLKIHPDNLNLPADDLRLVPILRKAAQLNIPVMFHSYPGGPGFYDMSAPNRMIRVFSDIDFITAHLGGMRHMDTIRAVSYVDISGGLFDLVDIYGIEIANNILRKIGVERLIFATDFPEFDYSPYFNVLNRMDFNEEEIKRVGYENIAEILKI